MRYSEKGVVVDREKLKFLNLIELLRVFSNGVVVDRKII